TARTSYCSIANSRMAMITYCSVHRFAIGANAALPSTRPPATWKTYARRPATRLPINSHAVPSPRRADKADRTGDVTWVGGIRVLWQTGRRHARQSRASIVIHDHAHGHEPGHAHDHSHGATFDYSEIPPGYYDQVMRDGPAIQRAWHRQKFARVRE